MNGRISVVMAVHNAVGTVESAIRSVWAQGMADLELIAVDDGSTDGSRDVLRRLDAPRLRVITQPNRGASAARNRGIAAATGDFIACLDADDVWLPGKLQAQRRALQHSPDAMVAYGWVDFVDDELRFLHRDQRATFHGDVYPELLRGNFISSGSNTMIRRVGLEQAGGFDISLKAVEDWELHVRLAADHRFVNVPRVVVRYRRSEQSLSSDLRLMEQSFLAARNRVFATAPVRYRHLEPACNASFYRYLAARSVQTGQVFSQPLRMLGFVWTSYRSQPGSALRLLQIVNPLGPLRLLLRKAWSRIAGLPKSVRGRHTD